MSKLNVHGWLVLCMCGLFIGVAGSGCCGGSSSAASSDDGGGASSSSGAAKTCDDISSISQCSEHTKKGMKLLGEDFYKGMCELTSGKWSDTACPSENVVGRCDDGDGSVTIYYSNGGSAYDASTARESCEFLAGTFKG